MKNILITGSPGVGKTTLIKKIVEKLKTVSVECEGFYTEEVRSYNSRIGFDIVTLRGEKGILARKNLPHNRTNKPLVGQYAVFVEDFEKLALPVFENPTKLLIIDEIGKIEMFSKKFQENVAGVFEDKTIQVIATVPLKGGPVLVRQLKERKDCQLITRRDVNCVQWSYVIEHSIRFGSKNGLFQGKQIVQNNQLTDHHCYFEKGTIKIHIV